MSSSRPTARRCTAFSALVAFMVTVALPVPPASAQGLFGLLFGAPPRHAPPPVSGYANPAPPPFFLEHERPSQPSSRYTSYCVRTCDGRYFPIERRNGMSPAQACNAFCPASETKVFSGSGIDHATASDGSRYAGLKTAYLYRDKLVTGCTCNGKSPLGLAKIDATNDPTLRKGDVVATSGGLMAYHGGRVREGESQFTPVESYSGFSKAMRQQLSEISIAPVASVADPGILRHSSLLSPAPIVNAQLFK